MIPIYRLAKRIRVWLGESTRGCEVALTYLKNVRGIRLKLEHETIQIANLSPHPFKHTEACLSQVLAIHSALCELYSRPWLSRTWVRQEIFASRSKMVHCGLQSIS